MATFEERQTDDLQLRELHYSGWAEYFKTTAATAAAMGADPWSFTPPTYMFLEYGPMPEAPWM